VRTGRPFGCGLIPWNGFTIRRSRSPARWENGRVTRFAWRRTSGRSGGTLLPKKANSGSFKPGDGRIPFAERYDRLAFPEPNSGCFIWMGALNYNGYGKMGIGHSSEGTLRMQYAYIVAYEHFVGPVPEGLVLDHKCRMKCCVNPDHLEPVTYAENTRRGNLAEVTRTRLAAQTHCKRGHLLSTDIRNSDGARICRACRAITVKAWKEKRRGQ
jgi:HNH endonuclease